MNSFQPPEFKTHWLIRGGHLQTIFSVGQSEPSPAGTIAHEVTLADQDAIVLQEDRPSDWLPGNPVIMLVHGLSGCHAAPYMIRLANRFLQLGWKTYRMDMRGCGAAWALAKQLTHAGRSDDIVAALGEIAKGNPGSPLHAIGVSLSANQLLRAVGRIGAGQDDRPSWFSDLRRIAAVVPPLDLQRCSDNMQRRSRRIYNYYFIRSLLSRVPKLVAQRDDVQSLLAGWRPRTLRELDDRMTAPLSGFADAAEYYDHASCCHVISHNEVPTLVVAAKDDPIVPVDCFTNPTNAFSQSTTLLVSKSGGHNGFIGPGKRCWIDDVMKQWFIDTAP